MPIHATTIYGDVIERHANTIYGDANSRYLYNRAKGDIDGLFVK